MFSSCKCWKFYLLIPPFSLTCRLPQTPLTPTTAAAHYFDDIFSKVNRPKQRHHLRRSSTTRSIGDRSDWASTQGDDDALTPINRTNSIGYLNEDDLKQKAEMDQHVAHYVTDQLERIRSNDSAEVEPAEFETSIDGALDSLDLGSKTNGHGTGSKLY